MGWLLAALVALVLAVGALEDPYPEGLLGLPSLATPDHSYIDDFPNVDCNLATGECWDTPSNNAIKAAAVAATPVTSNYRVGDTGGEGVYIRRTPNMADRITAWPDNTVMQSVAGGVVQGWQQVKAPDSTVGWIPEQYLIPQTKRTIQQVSPIARASGSYSRNPKWTTPVQYWINMNGSPYSQADMESVTAWAFDSWLSELGESAEFLGYTDARPNSRDGMNVIGWGYDPNPGRTWRWHSEGRLLEADVIISPPHSPFWRITMLHEVGHVLGLPHGGDGVMQEVLSASRLPKGLTESDRRMLFDIYGR